MGPAQDLGGPTDTPNSRMELGDTKETSQQMGKEVAPEGGALANKRGSGLVVLRRKEGVL